MRACWLKWVGRDWSISADYIWLNYSDANSVHRPQPQDLPGPILLAMWNLFVHGRPSVTGMRGEAFNGGAERQYSVRWTAVLIRNIGGVERV